MRVSENPNETTGTEFSGDEYDEAYPSGYELHYWHRARSDIVRDYVGSVCKKGETVLEIGAARGHYVRVLRVAGFDAYGCDLGSPRVHEEVRKFIFVGTDFASLEANLRERVTAVLLLDVIEHIERPAEFITSVLELLPAVRSIIVTVPARQELWSNYDEHYRHFLRYNVGKLFDIARASHLSVGSYGYFFHVLYLAAWLLKMIGLKRATAFGSQNTSGLHKLLGYLFWLESRLLPKRLFGTSLACVYTTEGRNRDGI